VRIRSIRGDGGRDGFQLNSGLNPLRHRWMLAGVCCRFALNRGDGFFEGFKVLPCRKSACVSRVDRQGARTTFRSRHPRIGISTWCRSCLPQARPARFELLGRIDAPSRDSRARGLENYLPIRAPNSMASERATDWATSV
jgi:hypothetical protein